MAKRLRQSGGRPTAAASVEVMPPPVAMHTAPIKVYIERYVRRGEAKTGKALKAELRALVRNRGRG